MVKLVRELSPIVEQPRHLRGVTRGHINTFTRKSRSRLIQKLSSVPRRVYRRGTVLITLTYPGVFDADPRSCKRDLDAFSKALLREVPNQAAFWKLEFQDRGAPHFHLLLPGSRRIPKEWISDTWYRIVGSGDLRHLVRGTRVEWAKHGNSAAKYATKYASKAVNADKAPGEWPGRFWGILNRAALGVELQELQLDESAWAALHRAIDSRRIDAGRGSRDLCPLTCGLDPYPLTEGGWWIMNDWEAWAALRGYTAHYW